MSEPSSSPEITFAQERRERLSAYGQDGAFQSLSQDWLRESMQRKYVYNFDWLGRPIIQYPQDMWAVQDLIWRVRPDLVIETGIAHGGSLVLSASMLAMHGRMERAIHAWTKLPDSIPTGNDVCALIEAVAATEGGKLVRSTPRRLLGRLTQENLA